MNEMLKLIQKTFYGFHDFHERDSSLVILAEESLAVRFGLLLVQEAVEAVELRLLIAVDVVPPVAHEVLLVEDGSVGTQEGRGFTTWTAHVEGLKRIRRSHFNV